MASFAVMAIVEVLIGPAPSVDREVVDAQIRAGAGDVESVIRWCGSEDEMAERLERCRRTGVPSVVSLPAGSVATALLAAAEVEGAPLVWLVVDAPQAASPDLLSLIERTKASRVIAGRGLSGYYWAVRHLAAELSSRPASVAYGPSIDQVGDLRVPDGEGPFPVAVLLHGGSWRERWQRDLMDPLAIDLAQRGVASFNLEYRRVGRSGGGWPTTASDVAAGIEMLVDLAVDRPLDMERVAVFGHSAGAQLSAVAFSMLAGRGARVAPVHLVHLAGVMDLHSSASRELDEAATVAYLGGRPAEVPERYASASPLALAPLGITETVVCGTADSPDLLDGSRRYAAAAGTLVEYLEIEGANHFDVIDPGGTAWTRTLEAVGRAW